MAENYKDPERAALLVLMLHGGEMPNAILRKEYGVELSPSGRKKLNDAGLLESTEASRRIFHKITRNGENWCEKELTDVEVPQGKGALVNVAFEVLRCLARHLRARNVRLIDVIRAPGEEILPGSLEDAIRRIYKELSSKPQDWVRLAHLRPKLDGAKKDEVDQTLLGMQKSGLVHLSPDSDRLALTEADHAAAIRVGKEDKHLVLIEES